MGVIKKVGKKFGFGLSAKERERNYNTKVTSLKRQTELEKHNLGLAKLRAQKAKLNKAGGSSGGKYFKASDSLMGSLGGFGFDEPEKRAKGKKKGRRQASGLFDYGLG